MQRQGSVKMTSMSLLLGWPLDHAANTNRPFASRRNRRHRGDGAALEQYRKDGHLVTFAPTGAGKGVRVIIPNLLHYDGPVITIDPKGENFAVTARYRSEKLGQRIFLLDPFEHVPARVLEMLDVTRATLNPLDLLTAKGELGPQLQMMASILSTESVLSRGDGEFWNQSARMLISGALGAAVAAANAEGKVPSFQRFMSYLTNNDVVFNLSKTLDDFGTNMDKLAYRNVHNFLQRPDKERSGVLSTALSYLTPFISDEVTRYLDTSSITPSVFLNDDNYTIYIVIPPAKLQSHSILLQLWISTMLNAIMERGEKPLKRTLFLLDECSQLGRLHALAKAVTLLRGYGLQVWMFFQDLAQLETNYGSEATTIVNNCGVFQAFGLSRNFAAEPIAKSIGKYEPIDLVQLDKTQQVLSISTEMPRIARLLNYLEDDLFAGRWDENPLFSKHRPEEREDNSFPPNALRIQI